MKMHINAFRITLATDKGPFGATALFEGGLNVVRAENTSGKSTLMNGMLYALGLEILVGKRGVESTKPVLWNVGDYRGEDFRVLESFVELETTNATGHVITVRRYVAGEKDDRLVEVVFGPVITGSVGREYQTQPFFVGVEGAAQRERGFHHFLAKFFDLKLPHVNRFKGEDVPLYVECIAPLMFIEQIRGWSGIQATLSQTFGIRNAARLGVEYILALDVIENEKRRTRIADEATEIRADWLAVRGNMAQAASLVGGRAMNVPTSPLLSLPDQPWIAVPSEGALIPIAEFLANERLLLMQQSDEASAPVPGTEELHSQLETLETQLVIVQAELSQARSELSLEEDESRKLHSRSEFLKTDIQRNKDIKRLRTYGLEYGLSVAHDTCPTCNQSIQDSLIPSGALVMDLDHNINFLAAEAEAVTLLLSTIEERLARLETVRKGKSERVAQLRTAIRDLRSDVRESRPVSIAAIRRQVHLQERVAGLEKTRDEFEALASRLNDIAYRWQSNRAIQAGLPTDYFSKEDKEKLSALSQIFSDNLRVFGYRSTGISDLHISPDNYRPVCDDFEVAFGASGSDNTRLMWAYTLALLQLSSRYETNHWGLLFYDEPGQQQMKEASSDALYSEIAKLPPETCQVIVATSAAEDETRRRLVNLPHRLLEFGDRVIRPL